MSSSNPTPLNSPQSQPSVPNSDLKTKVCIENALSQPFRPLDRASIIDSVDAEGAKLTEYEFEFNDMLLSTMLEVRAWSLARPVAEQEAVEDAIETKLSEVTITQDEQDKTRLRLLHFIRSIKSALAALTTNI